MGDVEPRDGRDGLPGQPGPTGRDSQVIGPEGPRGPRGVKGAYEAVHPYRWKALTVWIILFSVLVAFALRELSEVDEKIQAERALAIKLSCEETNRRHDNTLAAIDARYEAAKEGATADRIVELAAAREYTETLVEALVPKRDCLAEIRSRVNPPEGKEPASGN